ncbi:MAG TPA: MCE family protein [Pseudonocardiaceae bacterium]|jgi:virulence factor Mce-like protein|nr:MCE family protein [Pseudonocardiaceae bacterium]
MIALRRRLLGLLLVALVVAFLAVTVLVYNKAFSTVVPVSLTTDHAGNEMSAGDDVKVHGMLVGSVKSVSSTGDGAVLDLSLDPGLVDQIPSNVTAELLPTTLFGQRYVDLEVPANPSSVPIASGTSIGQDRTASGIEVEKVLDDLMPVLQAVQPQKLSTTLTAIATALQNRGPQLRQTIDQLASYTGQLNPQLPTLEHDLSALTQVTNTYNQAAPHLLNALSDLTVTSQTVASQASQLSTLYSTLTAASDNLQNFLAANQNNLIQLGANSLPTLDTLARYSPEYPCFLKQMAANEKNVDQAFGAGTNQPGLHARISVSVSRGKYVAGTDTPAYQDNRGPRCYDLNPMPNPFPQYAPDGPIQDGSSHPPAANTSSGGVLPSAGTAASVTGDLGLPNSPAEAGFLSDLLADQLGTTPQNVPGWSSLLVGPLFRGAEVNVQ